MKKQKMGMFLLILILLMTGVTGCEEKQEEFSEYQIYYVNKDKTRTVAVEYEPIAEDTERMIVEFLEQLFKDTNSPDYRKAIPEEVHLESWKLENAQLSLYFNNSYSTMDNITEILCRASIVRTLVQIEGIDCISFYVGDSPLVDDNGTLIGLMTAESFIENPGEQINSIQTADIILYFSNLEGTGLVQEVQKVHYSSNISMEKLVMEHLMKKPEGDNARTAIPSGTKLVSVSVLDGVCFVNLNEGFLNQNYEIAEPVVIYSIANSLVELPNVNKVQISVNGDSNMIYREKFDLNTMYERNLDYMDENAKTSEAQMEDNEEAGLEQGEEGAGD